MLKVCLVFWESEPQYAYKRYAYKKKHVDEKPCIPIVTIDSSLLNVSQYSGNEKNSKTKINCYISLSLRQIESIIA